MNNKHLGILIAAMGIILFALVLSTVPLIESMASSACVCDAASGGSCPHSHRIPVQIYLSSIILIVLLYLSYNLVTKDKPKKKKVEIPENLNAEEKMVMDELVRQDGMIFQSELVEKLGVSKVRVTRILDKLEGRNLIERRRRGMTNAVILKYKE